MYQQPMSWTDVGLRNVLQISKIPKDHNMWPIQDLLTSGIEWDKWFSYFLVQDTLSFDCYYYEMQARKVKTRTHLKLELSKGW